LGFCCSVVPSPVPGYLVHLRLSPRPSLARFLCGYWLTGPQYPGEPNLSQRHKLTPCPALTHLCPRSLAPVSFRRAPCDRFHTFAYSTSTNVVPYGRTQQTVSPWLCHALACGDPYAHRLPQIDATIDRHDGWLLILPCPHVHVSRSQRTPLSPSQSCGQRRRPCARAT